MILDLFSTMVGSFGTIIIEAIVIGLIMLWALMDTGKKADEQMEKTCRPEDCEKWKKCEFRKIGEDTQKECKYFHDDCQLTCDEWTECDEWEG